MLNAYFVSDIHISSPDSSEGRQFVAFLVSLTGGYNITHLFLLGDIFDLWVADHECFIDRYKEIIDQLQRLRNEGVIISYFEGNHDLYLRGFWSERLGFAVYSSSAYIQLGNTLLRLEHGDEMDPEDKGYLFLRWFLRTRLMRALISNLPGKLVQLIGENLSSHSRRFSSPTRLVNVSKIIKTMHSHARQAHEEKPFDLFIAGHTHVRDDSQISSNRGNFRSVNLGSWLDSPCYFKLRDAGGDFFELEGHAKSIDCN